LPQFATLITSEAIWFRNEAIHYGKSKIHWERMMGLCPPHFGNVRSTQLWQQDYKFIQQKLAGKLFTQPRLGVPFFNSLIRV